MPADNCQRFLQSDTIIARHAQITQNKKVAISVQYRKKEVNDEVNLLKVDTIILMGMVKHFQSSQNSTFAMSLQYLQKKVRDQVDFSHADQHQSGLQVDLYNLGTKVSHKVILSLLMSMIKHCQSTPSNKFANRCNISKKKLGMESFSACR